MIRVPWAHEGVHQMEIKASGDGATRRKLSIKWEASLFRNDWHGSLKLSLEVENVDQCISLIQQQLGKHPPNGAEATALAAAAAK